MKIFNEDLGKMEKIRHRGAELSVWIKGDGKNSLLFVHGFPFDHEMYRTSCEPLSDEFRVMIPDLRGFGESRFLTGLEENGGVESSGGSIEGAETGGEGESRNQGERVTMGEFADDLIALLDHFQIDKTILCGLSMGGYIAMNFARRYPERLAGLILCDTNSHPDPPEKRKGRLQLADSIFSTGPVPLPEGMIPNLLAPETRSNAPETVRSLREMILRQSPRGIAAAARGMADRDDSTPFLASIPVPALVIGGEMDPISPPEGMRSLANALSDARLVILKGAAHLPPMEVPAAFTDSVRSFARDVYRSFI